MRRLLLPLLVLGLAGAVSAAAPATEPPTVVGTVAAVVAADTLDVRLASGRTERLRVAGVHAPAVGACFGAEAAAGTRELALGQRVVVRREGGRAYVALPGGRDLGRLLVERGLAHVDVWGRPFTRFPAYVPLQRRAQESKAGMWSACAADVTVAVKAAPNPVATRGRLTYTVTISNEGPLAAPLVALELRPPAGVELVSVESPDAACATHSWFGTCTVRALAADGTAKATFVAEVAEAGAISTRAIVRLAGCVRAACGAAPLHDPDLRNDETAALITAADGAAPTTPSPGSGSPGGCHPSYPDTCIPPPPPDLDCADIPFRDFYVRRDIPGFDPHSFDGNEDGVGCQFDDY